MATKKLPKSGSKEAPKKQTPSPAAGEPRSKTDAEGEKREATVKRATLEKTIDRVSKFLAAIAASHAIYARLALRGWTEADMAEGRALLMALLTPAPSTEERKVLAAAAKADKRVAVAVRELDDLDEPHFSVAESALLHNFPDQHAFVFFELKASTGFKAVDGWRTMLTRLEALRAAPERSDTRKQDHEALALLAKRGLHAEELARIESLLQIAEGSGFGSTYVETSAADEAAREQKLILLRSWFEQWTAVARAQIKRRDHSIRLGLAQRRTAPSEKEETKTKKKQDEEPDEEPDEELDEDADDEDVEDQDGAVRR